MSVFSMLKRGRRAAKEHAIQQAEKQKKEAEQIPYKHVPRHAASDALAGGPATWREEDRPRIMEQNKRRSMMTANGLNMSGTTTPVHAGFPRVNSALSHVSYPAAYANPVVHLPRAYSYTSVQQPGWSSHGGEVVYTPMEAVHGSAKGKEVERLAMVDSGRASQTSSKRSSGPYPIERSATFSGASRTSPDGSSSNSNSSQDDLEMKAIKHASRTSPVMYSQSNTSSQVEHSHRLHPSKARRISDPQSPAQYVMQRHNSYQSQRQGAQRVTSLPATASDIPPVPALPPMHLESSLPQANMAAPLSAVPTTRGSPPRLPVPEEVASPILTNEADSYFSYLPEVGMAVTTPSAGNNKRKASTTKTARFTESRPIASQLSDSTPRSIPSPVIPLPVAAPFKSEVQTTITAIKTLPTMFDEASLSHQAVLSSPQKRGKLSKNPSTNSEPKSGKRNRWSLMGRKQTAVAV